MWLSWWEEGRDTLTIFLVDLIRYFQKCLAAVQWWRKGGSMWFDVWLSQMCWHRVKTCWKQTAKPRPQITAFQVNVVSRYSWEARLAAFGWNTKVQRLFSPLWAETIPTVLHPEVYRGYFAGCCAKRTVSPEQQQLHLGGVMLWYSVYSSLTSFYSEEILWRWLILELEQVHSNLLLLLGEPRGPCREESSDVAHSTVKHKQSEKEHLIEREENCELWVQPYHLDAENLFFFLRKKDPSFHLTFICSTLFTLLETVMLHLAAHQMTWGGTCCVTPA